MMPSFLTRTVAGLLTMLVLIGPNGIKRNNTQKEEVGGVKTVEVSSGGKYKTIEEARDYVRTLDKSKYDGIDIVIKGENKVTSAIELTAEDGGSEKCPIRYIGEDGAVITGGVTFSSSDFSPAEGETAQWFKEDAKENIVMIDLKQFGFTEEDALRITTNADGSRVHNINKNIIVLYANGNMATVARYPNEGYAQIDNAVVNCEGGANAARDFVDTTTVTISDEYVEEINSWHDISRVFVRGRFSLLWCDDNSRIDSLDGKTMIVPFAGGHEPRAGMFFICQNAPEMLDYQGEYYIDDNAILYYYKDAEFDNGESFSIPFADTLIKVDGADYLTVENLTIESAKGNIMEVEADHFTLRGCELRDSTEWVVINGNNNLIENNYFHDFANGILTVSGGDCATLTNADTIITNNEFYNWGILGRVYNEAVRVSDACGITVSHNLLHHAPHMAIGWTGNNNLFEYNEIYDVCNDTDDAGAIYSYQSYGHYGNVFKYNYIHDIMTTDKLLMNVPDYPYCKVSGIYWDGGKSGQTAIYNVFQNISGVGVAASGRDENVSNNLFISCGWGVTMAACYYQGHFGGTDERSSATGQGVKDTEAWRKAFPVLYTLQWDNPDPDDPNFYAAPTNNIMLNNYYFFDKTNCCSIKWYGHYFQNNIEESVYKFSGDTVEDSVVGVNTEWYSKRLVVNEGWTVEDFIEKSQATTGISLEEFAKIGLLD